MANTDKIFSMIMLSLVIIIAWSILLPTYFSGNSALIPSAFAQQQNFLEAEEEEEEDDVYSLYSRGYEAYQQGMYNQAIEYFDEVLAIDANDVDALNMKGVILNDQGYYEE